MAITPGACPPGRYDVSGTTDCVAKLSMLYEAYITAVSGKSRVVVRFNDRWSEYAHPDAPALLTLYMTLYAQCPGAQQAGLPNLNPGLAAKRGRPGRGYFAWPRL
jgi:hypothetical protein